MKKFLSLVLALIMTMSLVTVSAGAKDFTDDESVTYEEAVAVMSEIGVIDGYTDGSFKPQNGLTRGAAAKIICNMILGPTTASALRADTAPFKDVAVDNQYAGYIAYCVQQGITSGYTDGTYRPAASLTNFAFMKMLLCALGYDQNTEGYVGGNCFINVAKQAIGIGLNAGLLEEFDGGKDINREEAALFAFNTLKATMVEYDQKTVVTVGNAEVALSGNLRDVVNSAKTETIKDDNKMQFAEKYFGKLSLEADKQDVYGRPANTWTNGKEDIGTYVDYTELVKTYTDSVSAKELYDLLGKTVVEDYAITVYVDGIEQPIAKVNEIVKTNKTSFSTSGRGVKTEVFVDKDHEEVIITSINTYLAIATADYSAKAETATFEIYGLKKVNGEFVKVYSACKNTDDDKATGVKVSNDDIVVEDIKKDDVVLVTVAEGAIQTIDEPEVVEDVTITAFSKHSKVIADGETYKYCDTVEYNREVLEDYDKTNMKEKTYNVFLDPYGNLIGLEYVTVSDNYVFITGIDTPSNTYLDNGTYKVRGIFLDGTTAVFEAKAKTGNLTPNSQENKWYTYTVSKDVYTLTVVDEDWAAGDKVAQAQVADTAEVTIDYKHPSLNVNATNKPYVYGNNDTVYLTAKLGKVQNDTDPTVDDVVINGVAAVSTGIKNTSIVTYVGDATEKAIAKADGAGLAEAAYVLFKSNGYIIGAVVVGEDGAVSKNLVYVNSSSPNLEGYSSSDDEWTWTREVILNGEKAELTEVGSSLNYLDAGSTDTDGTRNGMFEGAWYVVSFDAKGNVTGISEVTGSTASIAYVGDYNDPNGAIQAAINTGKDTVLYEEEEFADVAEDNLPKLIEQTLYLDTTNTNGFYIAEDVKVVLIQKNYGKTTTTYEVGPAAIEAAIESLNAAADGNYDFEMNAVIERGAAQVVIIKDTTNGVKGTGDKTETDGEIAVKDVTSADLKDTAFEGATSYIAKGLKGEMVDDVLVVTGTIGKGYEFTGTSTTNVPGFGVMGDFFTVSGTPKTTGNGSSKIAIIPITADGEIYLWLIGDATETFTITKTVGEETVPVATVNVKNVIWA